jgi:hypothetical protein
MNHLMTHSVKNKSKIATVAMPTIPLVPFSGSFVIGQSSCDGSIISLLLDFLKIGVETERPVPGILAVMRLRLPIFAFKPLGPTENELPDLLRFNLIPGAILIDFLSRNTALSVKPLSQMWRE